MRQTTILLLIISSFSWGKVNIVASITDLADIAAQVGGDRVSVTSIARGNQDPHYVEILPSYMMKVRKADIYLEVGVELDLWARRIVDGSRNKHIKVIDCSVNIPKLEVPTGKIDASRGDIHRYGNPHYWLDPLNGKIIAEDITKALSAVDPAGRMIYEENLRTLTNKIDSKVAEWLEEYSSLQREKVIFYHNSWPYFSKRFGLKVVAFIEPKPGIMPSPTHLQKLIEVIEAENIKVVAMEPYFSDRAPQFLAQKTGIQVVTLAQSVGALSGADSYLQMIELNLATLMEVLGK
ncbi:MAG: metal ABC transporter substrate-binding protein [Fidelibacterota bacterium]